MPKKSTTRTFYRKHYTGYTTGSMYGRDDGYPEPRVICFDNIHQLAEDKTREAERIELVVETVSPAPADLPEQIAAAKKDNARNRHRADIAEDRRKLKELAKAIKAKERRKI